MQDLHKYLYAISAACFIGVGSGLITLLPYAIDYETKAVKAGYELEQATGLDYSQGIDCSKYPKIHADCEYATHLIKTDSVIARFLQTLAYTLFDVGAGAALLGAHFHPRINGKK